MEIKILIHALTELAKEYPNATVYFGHKDGSGASDKDPLYLIGEYIDTKNAECRAFCLGERKEITRNLEDPALYDFDSDTAFFPL